MNDIVKKAEAWLGTPYRHRSSAQGLGCDCVGLIIGLYQTHHPMTQIKVPDYVPDWAEVSHQETLIKGLRQYLRPIDPKEARLGDVLVFRMKDHAMAKHAAILSAGLSIDDAKAQIIHAYWGQGVVRSWLRPFWRKHIVGAFVFPI